MIGVAECPRENCPSLEHDIHMWELDGLVIATTFTCRICGAEKTVRHGNTNPVITYPPDKPDKDT